LTLNNKEIVNLSTDKTDDLLATDVLFVKQTKPELIASLTTSFSEKVNKSNITSYDSKKDVFRYLIEDVNESLTKYNIIVDGIIDLAASPQDINKKAYVFRMGKGTQNQFVSQLRFNVFVLPDREYTMVVEFFPQK